MFSKCLIARNCKEVLKSNVLYTNNGRTDYGKANDKLSSTGLYLPN